MRLGLVESARLGRKVGQVEGLRLATGGSDTHGNFRDPCETCVKPSNQIREALRWSGLRRLAVLANRLLYIDPGLKEHGGGGRGATGQDEEMGCCGKLFWSSASTSGKAGD